MTDQLSLDEMIELGKRAYNWEWKRPRRLEGYLTKFKFEFTKRYFRVSYYLADDRGVDSNCVEVGRAQIREQGVLDLYDSIVEKMAADKEAERQQERMDGVTAARRFLEYRSLRDAG